MANPTTNFNWQMPTSTDLVTDLPADFETFGQAVDTSLAELKGGTTGQVLSKTSNTDMDFTWVTTDDANAIQNSIVDAKGDIVAASANDTPARLAVGNNGETLVADSSTSTGLRWNTKPSGNKILNSDFSIWQRGTSFSSIAANAYGPDRWTFGVVGDVVNVTRQAFTVGDLTAIGYGSGKYFCRMEVVSSNGSARMLQKIENVETLANQAVTVSFWAKASATTSLDVYFQQYFGTGGSATVTSTVEAVTLTTSWQRFTKTITLASIAGKTIGADNYLSVELRETTASTNVSFDFFGVQVEAGSVATAFQTATGTIQGELAACQRYYWRASGQSTQYFGTGCTTATTAAQIFVQNPVPMRVAPTSIDTSGLKVFDSNIAATATAVIGWNAPFGTRVDCSFTGLTANRPAFLFTDSTGHLGFSAEL